MATLLRLDDITADDQVQPRADVASDVANDYAEAMQAGAAFPPVEVCYDGDRYWLWDGFQRLRAARLAGLASLPARIRGGDRDMARWLATSANRDHGQRRTTEDKRRAVTIALACKPVASDRMIADHVGVDNKTVAAVRSEVRNFLTCDNGEPAKRVGKDGKEYPARRDPPAPKPMIRFDATDEDELEQMMDEAEARLSPEGRAHLARLEREAADRLKRRAASREREQSRAERLAQAKEHLRQAVRHLIKAGNAEQAVIACQDAINACEQCGR